MGARQAGTRCRLAARERGRWARAAGWQHGRAADRHVGRGRRARGTAGWAAWARPGRAAGPMGCALGALSLF